MTAPSTETRSTNQRHYGAMELLTEIRDELRSLGSAAAALGITDQSKMFFGLASDVDSAIHKARDAFQDEFNEHYKSVERGAVNMVAAALAISAEKSK